MKISTKCIVSALAVMGIIGTVSTASAQLYQEMFTSTFLTSSGNENLSDLGWAATGNNGWAGYYDSRTAGTLINTGTGNPVLAPGTLYGAGAAYIGNGNGNTTYVMALYTDDAMGAGTYGYTAFSDINLSTPGLQATVLQQIEQPAGETCVSYLVIQNGGNWYASASALAAPTSLDPLSSSYGNFDPASLTITGTAANWVQVNGWGSSSLSLGSAPGSNLSGMITGIGILESLNQNGNWDGSFNIADLSVTGVPEPSLLALLGLGGLGLIAAYRRRMA